jgi:hypothetical protein
VFVNVQHFMAQRCVLCVEKVTKELNGLADMHYK